MIPEAIDECWEDYLNGVSDACDPWNYAETNASCDNICEVGILSSFHGDGFCDTLESEIGDTNMLLPFYWPQYGMPGYGFNITNKSFD